MKRLYLVVEFVLVVVGLLIGRELNAFSLIPRSIIKLPHLELSWGDFQTTAAFFVVIHMVVFLALAPVAGPGVFVAARRTAVEMFGVIFAVTLSSLALFFFTSTVYSPNLMLGVALSIFGLFFLAFVIAQPLVRAPDGARNPLAASWRLIAAGARQSIRPVGILVLLFTVSPLIMAKMFVSDRDFANKVTQVRVFFAPEDRTAWGLVNAFPGTAFLRPLQIQFPPNGGGTLDILERDGDLIRVPYRPGGKIDESEKVKLLDLTDLLGEVEIENGALGFDHHPEFGRAGSPNRGYIYVYYTAFKKTHQINHLSRFDVSLPTLEQRMASETPLFALRRNASGFHNAGMVEFGPDGFLYVSLGDANNPATHQRLDHSLFASIIRIDVDGRGGEVSHPIRRQPVDGQTQNYFIPNDNPFSGRPDSMEEFWALGLRNPFRFTFDRETGQMWTGDVGTDVWEEVNRIRRGGNYQFPYIEGRERQQGFARPERLIGTEYPPVYTYRHTSFDRAVIGGVVYRGDKLAGLAGKYLFADSYSGKVFAFDAKADRVEEKDVALIARAEGFTAQRGVTSLTLSPDGEVLITAMGRAGAATGQILRLVTAKEAAAVVKETPEPPAAPGTADARAIFVADCSRCHGRGGKGDGPDAKNMMQAFNLSRMPDFTAPDYDRRRSLEQIERIILKGGPAAGLSEGMPPWEGIYSAAEIEALAAYVRNL